MEVPQPAPGRPPVYIGLSNAVIESVEHMRVDGFNDELYVSRLRLRHVAQPLWYRGRLQRFGRGADAQPVSIIYESIGLNNDVVQFWVHLMDAVALDDLVARWNRGESQCQRQQPV